MIIGKIIDIISLAIKIKIISIKTASKTIWRALHTWNICIVISNTLYTVCLIYTFGAVYRTWHTWNITYKVCSLALIAMKIIKSGTIHTIWLTIQTSSMLTIQPIRKKTLFTLIYNIAFSTLLQIYWTWLTHNIIINSIAICTVCANTGWIRTCQTVYIIACYTNCTL